MSKSVFISYSRKDAIDVAEFRSIDTFRDFEILIDDEEIEFNKPWKQNIRNKINDSNGAILFLTKNALNPESPIRTLELPLIAKRYVDKEDNFNFFPIFLEDIDEELLNNYSFTPLETKEEVNFLEFFQLYDEQQRTTVRELTNRKRKHFYKTANANISHILEGGTLSPGETMLSKLSRKQRIRNLSIGFALVISVFLFARTDTFARVLINAAERVQPENIDEGNSILFNAIAGQLNDIDNLEELGADQSLVENIEEVNQVNSESNEQGLSSSISADTSTTTISTSTTTTTTVAPATTTSSTPTTTTTTIKTYSLKFSDNVVEFPEIPYCKMTYEEVEEQLKAHFLANDIRLTIRKFLVETENTDCYGLASGSNKPYLVEIKDGDFIEVTVEWSSSKREFPTTIANSPNAIGNNERWDVYCDNSGKSYLDDAWRGEKTGSGSDQYFYFGLYTDLTSPDISCVPDAMLESLGYFLNSGYYCKNEGCVTSSNATTTTTTLAPTTTTTTTLAPTTTTTTTLAPTTTTTTTLAPTTTTTTTPAPTTTTTTTVPDNSGPSVTGTPPPYPPEMLCRVVHYDADGDGNADEHYWRRQINYSIVDNLSLDAFLIYDGDISQNKLIDSVSASGTSDVVTIDTGSYPLDEDTNYVLYGYARDKAGNLSVPDTFLWTTPTWENPNNLYGCESHNESTVDHSGLNHTHP